MRLPYWGQTVDRAARDHAASVVSQVLARTLEWSSVPATLGPYSGRDRGVAVIHQELRSVAADAAQGFVGSDPDHDTELNAVLERTRRFLQSGTAYRWHEKGPVEIMGAYMGIAALTWFAVAAMGALLGFGHEAVIAAALFAFLLMYVMVLAMAVSLLRRMWWRITARRERATRAVWPFFTAAEYHAAGPPPMGSDAW